MKSIFIKKLLLFAMGSVCRVKRFHLGSRHFADEEEFEMEARKWLRQRAKILLSCGFRRTGKAMGQMYQCWVKDMSRNKCFFQVRISLVLRFKSICHLFTDSSL
jgi:hypothetical protein